MIIFALAWRADIALRGFLAEDDFILAAIASGSDSPDFLLTRVSNHVMPGGLFLFWLVTRTFGLVYWPYAVLLLAGEAALSVAFYRLLRQLFPPRWGLLVPLAVLLFSPLTLDVTSFWTTGVLLLPMQLAMVLAIGAQVKYVRTGRVRHLATLGLSVVFGLLFFEKSLLIVPLVFLATACLFATGGPIRSVGTTIRRYWPSWLVLGLLSAGYLLLYLSRAESSLRVPGSAVEVITFVRNMVGSTLVPGLLGGPWQWTSTGDAAPVSGIDDFGRWLAWALILALVLVTVWRRPSAVRAWILLALYVAFVAGLLAATRLGTVIGGEAGLATRYVSDVVVVAALCIGVGVLGLAEWTGQTPVRSPALPGVLRESSAVAAGVVVALLAFTALSAGTAWSWTRFGDIWAVKQGRAYLETARADLAKAPPGTVFFDATVPEGVIPAFTWPYNLQSHFFRPLDQRPVFVTEAEKPSIFDNAGHIRPLRVEGTATLPGPDGDCGYKLTDGRTVRMPLATTMFEWPWVVRVGYLSSGDSTAVLRFGTATHQFRVHRGLNQLYFVLPGKGNAVELTINDPTVAVCSDGVMVGNAYPQP